MKHDLMKFGPPIAKSHDLVSGVTPDAPAMVRLALHIMKLFGLFHLARYVTCDGLRIICYHGFAVAEEYKFRGRLFIRKELFLRRIEYLHRKRFPILPLSTAVEALDENRLPPCATVIT